MNMEPIKKLGDRQYSSYEKFNARIYLNSKFAINKHPWPAWIFDHIDKKEPAQVLELGCGNGLFWKFNASKIPSTWNVVISDYSPGMVSATQNTLKNVPGTFVKNEHASGLNRFGNSIIS
jgi:ubiquinone/menaquinone biosynthesis C-methylase UbiE